MIDCLKLIHKNKHVFFNENGFGPLKTCFTCYIFKIPSDCHSSDILYTAKNATELVTSCQVCQVGAIANK